MIRFPLRARSGVVALAAGVVLLVAGCASQSPPQTDPVSRATKQHSTVTPLFGNDAVRQQVIDLGLMHPFSEYWAAYVAGDWQARYGMEQFQRPVDAKFYATYHQAAWQLLELRVDAVDVTGAPERVRVNLHVRFRNPSRLDQERASFLQDLWSKSNDQWMHVNSDPMLNGLRSVK